MANGVNARVFGVYALAVPACLALAAIFPGYVSFDADTHLLTISATLTEIGAAFAGGYGIIAGVFGLWGIKR